jgi:hypothetical protein
MSFAFASPSAPGKQNGPRLGVRGSAMASKPSLRGGARRPPLPPVAQAENRGFGTLSMLATADSPLLFAFCCFPHASPTLAPGTGKQKTPRRALLNSLDFQKKPGAGEGIRTLDPNLGNGPETFSPRYPAVSGTTLNQDKTMCCGCFEPPNLRQEGPPARLQTLISCLQTRQTVLM